MSVKISALPAASAVNVTESATGFPFDDSTPTTTRLTIAQLRVQLDTILKTSTVDGLQFVRLGASTSPQYFDIRNTSGLVQFGTEGSIVSIITGASAYDAVMRGVTGLSLSGDGSAPHIRISTAGAVAIQKAVTIATGGLGVSAGDTYMAGAALATNATTGHHYIPSCSGTPTGVPAGHTGQVAIQFDTSTNKIFAYLAGSWKATGALT